ncbi:enterotoxin A family protein [Escherichia coli]|nr:enterotoxin A family protein [Escherichia coli]PAL27949.1 Heat-labile enterotoxin IIA, A chain [Escherichia coli]PAL39899.1 Heat-labile enterotoxin IIA, A chain [Escherichia coli]PAL44765.1 Heat-labile enterotoxin IIA, A chain [Escherichia coli]HAL0808134.1 Heat-labile enterotoxin IIA, A chain [Escherichia coli]HDX4255801.1 enterotoxin A family protein [Escherichia coli]
MKKLVLLFFCCFFSASSSANDFYRADARTPEDIRRDGGLLPRGQSEAYEHGTPVNINLYDHARGTVTGNTRYNDGYVSTTTTLRQAHLIGQNFLGGYNEYYIYVVAAAPNLLNVNGVLGRYSPHPDENEFAALGGIPLSQIIGWYRVFFGVIEGGMQRNRDYRGDLFRGLTVAPNEDGYQLAGFPANFPAWRETPWSTFAPEQCGPNKKTIKELSCTSATNALSKYDLMNFKKFLKRRLTLMFLISEDDFINVHGDRNEFYKDN